LFYIFDEDVGKSYFETYDVSYQNMLTDCIDQYTEPFIQLDPSDRKIIGTPYYQEDYERIILHLVNYDHIGFFDFIWPHSNIQVQLKQPDFEINSITLKNIDGSTQELTFEITDEILGFTIPHLKDYAVILIE